MIKRKIELDINAFPSELHEFLRSGDIYDSSSSPEARTLYCDSGYYIKIARSGELALEATLCRRFHSMGLGVEVLQYITADQDYFVTKSAVGEDLTHFLDDPKKLCQVLAPSMDALSYSSWGIVVSPVDSSIVLKGIPIQTFAIMTTSMAVFELVSQSMFCEIRCRDLRI
jgi:hypothetical protein